MAGDNTVLIEAEKLTDEHIAKAKGNKPNVIVGIGFLGEMTLFLNPKSAESVIDRYKAINDEYHVVGYTAKAVGFDDIFDAYDFSENHD